MLNPSKPTFLLSSYTILFCSRGPARKPFTEPQFMSYTIWPMDCQNKISFFLTFFRSSSHVFTLYLFKNNYSFPRFLIWNNSPAASIMLKSREGYKNSHVKSWINSQPALSVWKTARACHTHDCYMPRHSPEFVNSCHQITKGVAVKTVRGSFHSRVFEMLTNSDVGLFEKRALH